MASEVQGSGNPKGLPKSDARLELVVHRDNGTTPITTVVMNGNSALKIWTPPSRKNLATPLFLINLAYMFQLS